MRKIGVIGGSGFIGSFLIDKLGVNKTLNFDKNPSVKYEKITTIGNILNKSELNSFLKDIDCVVLLAAEHKDNIDPVSLYYDVNVEGTKNVLDLMSEHNINHLIFTSTVAIYGLDKKYPSENTIPEPFNHYGKSKLMAEDQINNWYSKNPRNKSVTIIRPTVVFGENNRGNVYNLINQIRKGKFMMIGSGKNKKSIAYVGNIVSFIDNLISSKPKGISVYNYCDLPNLNMSQLTSVIYDSFEKKKPLIKLPYFFAYLIGFFFDILSKILKTEFPISRIRIKKFISNSVYDSKKSHTIFNQKYNLEESIRKTIIFEFNKNC